MSHSITNFISKETDNGLFVVFDCVISAVNDNNDTSTSFETVYLVISDKLDLPYFQTQPETWLGDNAVSTFFKEKAGVNDLEFPQRPEFSRKYVVDISPENALQVFTPPVFDFYEQNQLNRIIGEGKMLSLVNWQAHPIDQTQVNANLHILQQLYQLLMVKKSS